MELERTKTGQRLVEYFNKSENKRYLRTEKYLWMLGYIHDLQDSIEIDSIVFARAIKNGNLGHPGIDFLSPDVRHQLTRDIAWHDVQMPLSAGYLPAYTRTKLTYKPSNESKVLSNLHRDNRMEQFDLK